MAGISARIDTAFNDANDPLQELVAAVPSQRNWKGMAIAILVILSVIGLVALAVVIVTPPDPGPRLKGRRIQLLDVLSGRLKPRYFNGTWVSGKSKAMSKAVSKAINIYGPPRGQILYDNSLDLKPFFVKIP